MSGSGEVLCEGWLRKSPPEKKLRRYAWKRRWFVLRSGRLSGEPDVLQYYKNPHSRRPIRTIDLNLCEQVDAGLSFTKKELEKSFAFDLRTQERTWYLVAETEEDMNRWVSSICLLCGFNPTDDIPSRPPHHPMSSTTTAAQISNTAVASISTSLPDPYNAVRVPQMESNGSMEDDYLWLSNCQSHIGPSKGSCISLDIDSNSQHPRPSAASSSCSSSSSSPSLPPNPAPFPPASSSRTVPWTVPSSLAPRSISLDASLTPDFQKPGSRFRSHPSPHPRKHSLDFHLRPVALPADVTQAFSGYQFPRPASTPQPPPHRRPSSTPSVDSLTQSELYSSTPTPPPRPPKPAAITTPTEGSDGENRSDTNSTRLSEKDASGGGINIPRSRAVTAPSHTKTGCDNIFIPRSLSDRASMFDFSESFNSYFLNKGMVPLGSVCSEDDEVDENYVPMSAATTEPPITARAPPAAHNEIAFAFHEANYVSMTPFPPGFTALPNPSATDPAALGRQVPPPAHMGFRGSQLSPVAPLTPTLCRNTLNTSVGMEVSGVPPPVNRNLKPQRKAGACVTPPVDRRETAGEHTHKTRVKPAPLNIAPVQQDWQEVPPPVRSPVTRTFTRDPSSFCSVGQNSGHSSSLSSDSDEPDDNYVPMTTPNLSISAGESSLRLMMHRASEGGVSSPLPRRARSDKQVEYLDLDLHTGRSTPNRQKRNTEDRGPDDKNPNVQRTRVDYVVVDPTKTKALRNTREAWHGGRMSTEKEK